MFKSVLQRYDFVNKNLNDYVEEENIDEDDEFACLKQLNLSEANMILNKCISYAHAKNKIIILLGFSVGAALGMKLIENYD